tara:strand:+ start:825 stop:1007 length:183 start_codon:yes stop_codon:yes gene_type:complete
MASIEELYNKSEFSKLGNSNKDKTPLISADSDKLSVDEKALEKARGGKLNQKKYSDSVSY